MRIIEVIAPCGHADTLKGIAEQFEVLECWVLATDEEDRCSTRMLVQPEKQQKVLDAIQHVIDKIENVRLVMIPIEAVLPRIETNKEEEEEDEGKKAAIRSREELYAQIVDGSQLNSNFITMVLLSTIVATIGLLEDSSAVVIGAMVIAPLLGPNIALAFGTALGDSGLVWQALKTNLAGILLTLLISVSFGIVWPYAFETRELLSRTGVGIDGVILALASGAAAVISLVTGWRTSIVGVMVAVALLPPTVTLGLMLGGGQFNQAQGAALLLAVNIVCVNLSAKLAFVIKGVKPRTWLEKQKARQSIITYIIFWLVVLIALIWILPLRFTTLAQ